MDEQLTVLVVEDDPYILKLCSIFLKEEGYHVLQAQTGREAMASFQQRAADIVLLDLGLPDIDGLELIPLLRGRSKAPIIVISARTEESEKIRALDLGADDYMGKPFHTGELMARVRVAHRRCLQLAAAPEDSVFSCGALQVDFNTQKVSVQGQPVHLTPMEYKLLHLLIRNHGKVLTHHYIQTQIWGDEGADKDSAQSLRVFMANLRRKLEGPGPDTHYIVTQVGIGYMFMDQ